MTSGTFFGFGPQRVVPAHPDLSIDTWIDPAWRPPDRDAILRYVAEVPAALVAAVPPVPCSICGELVPQAMFQFDGLWLWPASLHHHMRVHDVRPPDAIVLHIRANGYGVPGVPEVAVTDLPWPE
jgi:hypothetical protein